MKKFTLIILFFITLTSHSQTICKSKVVVPIVSFDQCNTAPWALVFEDNFDDNNLDLSIWEIQQWAQGAFLSINVNTQEYNSLDNAIVSNGTLKIIANNETVYRKAVYWRVVWSQGTVEPGSSGGPLFNNEHLLIGQVPGGNPPVTSKTLKTTVL